MGQVGHENQDGGDLGAAGILPQIRNQISNLVERMEEQTDPRARKAIIDESSEWANSLQGQSKYEAILQIGDQYRRWMHLEEASRLYDLVASEAEDPGLRVRAIYHSGEIELFQDQDGGLSAISSFEKAAGMAAELGMVREEAEILGRLGTAYLITNQNGKMLDACECFNSLPDEVKQEFPAIDLSANLKLAREYSSRSDSRSREYFARALEVARSNPEIGKDVFLSLLLERNGSSGVSKWNSVNQISVLREHFEDDALSNEPDSARIGMVVFWAYFLERDQNWNRFEAFFEQFVARMDSLNNLDAFPDTSGLGRDQLAQMAASTVAAFAFAGEEANQEPDTAALKASFEDWMKSQKSLAGSFPAGANREEISLFAHAIKSGILEVFRLSPDVNPLESGKAQTGQDVESGNQGRF